MVDDALPLVEGGDGPHVGVVELEVGDVEVGDHALAVDRLGDDDDVQLDEVAQGHLGGGLAVLLADGGEHRVGEDVVAALGERPPGLQGGVVLGVPGAVVGLLVEDVSLHLVDGRRHLDVLRQVHEPVGEEVGDADGADLAGGQGLLHGAVGAVVVAEGLVDEQQVDVVGAQAAQGAVDGAGGALLPGVGDPHLGGQEEVLAGQSTGGDGRAHTLLVAVGLGGVDVAVADLEGLEHGALGLLRRGQEDAVADLRDVDAIVESDGGGGAVGHEFSFDAVGVSNLAPQAGAMSSLSRRAQLACGPPDVRVAPMPGRRRGHPARPVTFPSSRGHLTRRGTGLLSPAASNAPARCGLHPAARNVPGRTAPDGVCGRTLHP